MEHDKQKDTSDTNKKDTPKIIKNREIMQTLYKNNLKNSLFELKKHEENKHFLDINNPKIYKVNRYISLENIIQYVFVGECNDNIKEIFAKIEKNSKTHGKKSKFDIKLNKKEENILIDKFGIHYRKILCINNISKNNLVFVYILIYPEDTIQMIQDKIMIYVNEKITPPEQFLWVKLKSERMINKKKRKYYSTLKNADNVVLSETLLKNIHALTGNTNTTFDDIELTNHYPISLTNTNYFNFDKINNLLDFSFENMVYDIETQNGNLFFKNPFVDTFIENTTINDSILSTDKKKKILLDYFELENDQINLIYIVDFRNNSNNVFNKSTTEKIISKYWNKLKNSEVAYNKQYVTEMKPKIDAKQSICDYIYLEKKNIKDKITLISSGITPTIIHINYYLNTQPFIDFDFLFKNLELSFEIPFINYKSDNSNESKYKIYVPSTQQPQHAKYWIEKEVMKKWKSDVPKGFNIKQLLFSRNDVTEYSYISIQKNGQIDLKVYFKGDDNSTLSNISQAIFKCRNLIIKINELLEFDKNSGNQKIILPNYKLDSKLNFNTEISSINIHMNIKLEKDIKIQQLKNTFEKIPFLVEIIKNSLTNIEIRYKRISNNESHSTIFSFISKQKYDNPHVSDNDLNKKIQELYRKTYDETALIIKKWKEEDEQKLNYADLGTKFVKNIFEGLYITISTSSTILKHYKIQINGIKNHRQIPYITDFIQNIFLLVLDNYKFEKPITDNNNTQEFNYNDVYDYDQEHDNLSLDYDEFNDFIDDDFENYDFNDYKLNTGKDMNTLTDFDGENDNNDNNNDNDNDDDEDDKDDYEEYNDFQNGIDNSYELNRLKKFDNKLFNKKKNILTNKRGYASKCLASDMRQPIVIDEENKQKIEKKYPDSFPGGILEYPQKNNDSENKRYYMCPVIWCVKDEISLSPNDTIINEYGDRTCPKCGGVNINTTIIYDKPPLKTLLIRDRGWDKNYKNYKNSQDVEGFLMGEKWKDMYPGLVDSPMCLPCCFKIKSNGFNKKMDQCLNKTNKVDDSTSKDRYVVNELTLSKNKLGILPNELNELFGNVNENMFKKNESGILNYDVGCYLRRGIEKHPKNSFLLSVFDSVKYKYNNNYELFCETICDNLTPDIFIQLNMGDLVKIFNYSENNKFSMFWNIYTTKKKNTNELHDNTNIYHYQYDEFMKWCKKHKKFIDNIFDSNFLLSEFNLEYYFETSIDDVKRIKHINTVDMIFNIYNSIEVFKHYIKNKVRFKDDVLLYDFVSKEGIIEPDGFKIIMFNNIRNKVTLNCPLWEYAINLKKIDGGVKPKKILCILKHIDDEQFYYEPIYYVKIYKDGSRDVMPFISETIIINGKQIKNELSTQIGILLNKQIQSCAIRRNRHQEKYYKDNNYVFSKTSTEIYNLLTQMKPSGKNNVWTNGKFMPIYQIVNADFKSIGFIIPDLEHSKGSVINTSLKNKCLIPFAPSKILPNIPIIFGIHYYIPNTYTKTIATLKYLDKLFKSGSETIDTEPIENIVNESGKVYLIKIKNNNYIPVVPENITKHTTHAKHMKTIEKDVDIYKELKINYHKYIVDERGLNVWKNEFENNSYNQLRYELGRYLNLNNLTEPLFEDILIFKNDIVEYKNNQYEIISINVNNTYDIKNIKTLNILEQIPHDDLSIIEIKNPMNKTALKNIILKIVDGDTIPIETKRNILKNILIKMDNKDYEQLLKQYGIIMKTPVFDQIAHFGNKNTVKFNPNSNKKTRKRCGVFNNETDCLKNDNCKYVNERCKLFINEYNLLNTDINNKEKYSNLIIEELIKNKVKRNEILNNKVSKETFSSIIPNEYEIVTTDSLFIEKINSLYNLNKSIEWDTPYNPIDKINYPNVNQSLLTDSTSLSYYWMSRLDDFNLSISIQNIDTEHGNENSFEKIFSIGFITLKHSLIKSYEKQKYKDILDSYRHNILNDQHTTFNNYNFIKTEKDFKNYIHENNNLNLYDFKELASIYKKNIILLDNVTLNVYSCKHNENIDEQYLLVIMDKNTFGNLSFKLLYKGDKYKFNYEDFSVKFRNDIENIIKLQLSEKSKKYIFNVGDAQEHDTTIVK
jgi:hypothetical protein